MRFLALGDSYTIGEGVAESERWPEQLFSLLQRRGFAANRPHIVARTGWTTAELLTGIGIADLSGAYHLVSLQIGVNNQYRGLSRGEYGQEFASLLKRALGFADERPERVVVLSIPDWGVTPFAADRDRQHIAAEIDEFNRINRKASQESGVHYVDVTGISRKAGTESALLAGDGLHPSGKMYGLWAQRLLPWASDCLNLEARN